LNTAASEDVLNSESRDAILDTFAKSWAETDEKTITERKDELYEKDGSSEWDTNEEFKKLAAEYKVTDQMNGDDKHDLQ
jgi:hypothetical protein